MKKRQAAAPSFTDLQGNGTTFSGIIGYSVQFLNKIKFFEKFVKIKINNLLMSFNENIRFEVSTILIFSHRGINLQGRKDKSIEKFYRLFFAITRASLFIY